MVTGIHSIFFCFIKKAKNKLLFSSLLPTVFQLFLGKSKMPPWFPIIPAPPVKSVDLSVLTKDIRTQDTNSCEINRGTVRNAVSLFLESPD